MSVLIHEKKVNGGIVATPGSNVNTWYNRMPNNKLNINGSYAGLETPIDWVLINTVDSKWIKSGIVTFNSERKSTIVKLNTPFVNDEYYIFLKSNQNINLFWTNKKYNQFTVTGSLAIGSEFSWIAIHKKIGQQTGILTPKSIYVGQRVINTDTMQWDGAAFVSGDDPLNPETLPLPADAIGSAVPPPPGDYDSACNLNGWYKNELIIRPTQAIDGISANNLMDFSSAQDYSVILSSNININTFWMDKRADRVKIGTSYANRCIIDYLFIKTGLNWWDEV